MKSMKLTRQPHRQIDLLGSDKPRMLRRFQWKYTSFLLGATLISILIVGGTTYYMNQQNYEMFLGIATRFAPALIENLERERYWTNSFLILATLSIFTTYTLISINVTSRLVIPILLLQRHLKNLTRGDLNQRQIRIRQGDEFQDLIDTYNYFYSSLQLQAKHDLIRLRSIPIDSNNREAQKTMAGLILEKQMQVQSGGDALFQKVPTPGANAGSTPDSRLVS